MANLTMQQNSSSRAFSLPEPKTLLPDSLVDILVHLEIPVPTAETLGWQIPPSNSGMNVSNDRTPVTEIIPTVLNPSTLSPTAIGPPIPLEWNYQAPIYVSTIQQRFNLANIVKVNGSRNTLPSKRRIQSVVAP